MDVSEYHSLVVLLSGKLWDREGYVEMGLSILFPAESFPFPEFPHDYIILCVIQEGPTGLERKKRDALCDTSSEARFRYSDFITSPKRPRRAEDYVAGHVPADQKDVAFRKWQVEKLTEHQSAVPTLDLPFLQLQLADQVDFQVVFQVASQKRPDPVPDSIHYRNVCRI